MEDLDTTIKKLSDLDRVSLIRELIRIDSQAQALARGPGRRSRIGSIGRNRSKRAREQSGRLGAIIYFLQFRSPVPDRDRTLCEMLAEELTAKGQWTGEC